MILKFEAITWDDNLWDNVISVGLDNVVFSIWSGEGGEVPKLKW